MASPTPQPSPDTRTEEALLYRSIVRGILGDDFQPSEEPYLGATQTGPRQAS